MNLELMYWGSSLADDAWNVASHRHTYWQASLACAGECLFLLDGGKKLTVHPGEMLFLPPGTEHALHYSAERPYRSYTFKFRCDDTLEERLIFVPESPRSRAVLAAVEPLMRAWFPAEKFGDPFGAVVLPGERYAAVIEGLLAGVLRYESDAENRSCAFASRVRALLRRDHRSSVTEIAEKMGLSRNHFCVRLKRESGLSAKAFFDRETVRAARRYLEYTELRVGEIALRLGFRDVFAFDAFFRRCTGTTPGEFRRGDKNAD